MPFQTLPSELLLQILEECRPDGFENLVLTCRHFHQVVTSNPLILWSHNKYRKQATNLIINKKVSQDGNSTYIFRALNQLAERNSYLQKYTKVLHLEPSDRPWLDLREEQAVPYTWPPKKDDEEKILDKGARFLHADEPEFVEFKAFCEHMKQKEGNNAQINGLTTQWPAFADALLGYQSENDITEICDNPDSAMILLALSLPNVKNLVIHDRSGQFTSAFNGVFRAITTAENFKTLQTLQFVNDIEFFPLQLVVPFLSFVPLQELRMHSANDMWTHPEYPCCSLVDFKWLTPEPLMTISKLVIRTLDTQEENLRSLLSKARNLKSLWLGFGSWDWAGRDQRKLIQTINDTVGSGLEDLTITYRSLRDYRDIHYDSITKNQVLDFRAFTKLTRLALHARCWENGEFEGFSGGFSVDDHGEYDFLPPCLNALYLFKSTLSDDSFNEVLEAVHQTKAKAPSLKAVFLMANKEQIWPDVSESQEKLAAVNVDIWTRQKDVRQREEYELLDEYLGFFQEHRRKLE